MSKLLSSAVLLTLLITPTAYADKFDTDPTEILQKLKNQKKTIKLRSISAQNSPQNAIKTRALKRITNDVMDDTKSIEEVVHVQSFDNTDRIKLNIAFDYGKSSINESSRQQLQMVAAVLNDKSVKYLPISVNGHTDSDGDERYNLQLSYERANAVKHFLVNEYGVMAARLTVSGYGENDPVALNASEAGKALNRRVEISLVQ